VYDLRSNGDERAVSGSGARASATYTGIFEDERPFSLRDVAQIIRKRLWVIVLVTLVFVGAAVAFTRWQTPVYEASVQLLVGQEVQQGDDQQISPNLAGSIEGLQQLTQTIVEAIDSRPVAEETIQRLGLQMDPGILLNNLTAEQVGSTQFILLTYQDADPQRAQEIANTVSQVSSERMSQVSPSASGIRATIWEDATVPNTPVSPDPVRNAILALALGLMFGIGLTFVMEYLDDSWRSPEELEQVSGVPTFGVIPKFEIMKRERRERR
jgi:capsular polysaccharide biosynthesis protein